MQCFSCQVGQPLSQATHTKKRWKKRKYARNLKDGGEYMALPHVSAHRVVGYLGPLILIYTQNIPEAGINCDDQKAQEEHGQQAASSDPIQPCGVIADVISGRIKNDLVYEHAQQRDGREVLEWNVKCYDMHDHVRWSWIQLQTFSAQKRSVRCRTPNSCPVKAAKLQ
jgi:hypothetical protein